MNLKNKLNSDWFQSILIKIDNQTKNPVKNSFLNK